MVRILPNHEVEKLKPIGALSQEEWLALRKITEIAGGMSSLMIMHPLFNHQRVDPYLRRNVKRLKAVVSVVKTE